MSRGKQIIRSFFSLLALASLNSNILVVRATDLVPSDDLTNGASVFVFRDSRKKPQEKAGGAAFRAHASGSVARRDKLKAQLASVKQKKSAQTQSRQAELAKVRARERNVRLKLSNTLTARADAMMVKGDITGATTNYREALKANPKNADAMTGLSEALTVKGVEIAGDTNNEAALPYLEEAAKNDPKNSVAFAKLGEVYDTKGANDKAVVNYEKALAIDPELTSLYVPLGLAYIESGDTAKAETYLAKADAAGMDTSDAKFARIDALSKQNKNPEALAALDQMIKAQPQNGEAYYQRAVIYDRTNQTDKAVDSYKEAVRVDPQMSAAWFDLGVIYYNKGDYNNAMNAYQQSLRVDNTNAQAHANLASTFRQMERYPEANAEYKQAEANGMKTPDLYSEWGFCLGKTSEWDKSVARLETAQTMSPTAIDDTNVGWAYYNAGQADKAKKNDAAAQANLTKGKTSLQKAVQKDPNLDAAYLNLGATDNSLGDHDDAVVALNQAVKLHNDWVLALNQLGLAYRGTNSLALALAQFDRVVTIDGNNVMGLFNLGSAQYANGDKKNAKKTQDRLRKLNPSLADQLGNIIAGVVVDEAGRQIRKRIRIPGIPF